MATNLAPRCGFSAVSVSFRDGRASSKITGAQVPSTQAPKLMPVPLSTFPDCLCPSQVKVLGGPKHAEGGSMVEVATVGQGGGKSEKHCRCCVECRNFPWQAPSLWRGAASGNTARIKK